ncbi:hypothetical protein [Jatrophihabitans sp.]|uniref:hypothetical protein n=1 Tax=Jatrophihabitans sp. TaxID=1932789 RepID=UPI0030C65F6F|nr:hypothetical protein [Jatrophihabitans sp.]
MGSYVVSTVDGAGGLSGFVEDLDTGQVQHFADAGALVAALSADGPRDPVRSLATQSGDELARRRRPAL